jgi:hypothetical protein
MNIKRTATLGVVGGALAAWLAAAATSGVRESAAPIPERPSPIDANGNALAAEIARLHEHLRPSASPRQPSRNLFTYAPRPSAAPALPPPVSKPALVEAPASRPPAPAFKLPGIAEDTASGTTVRTAIISSAGQLFLAKEGDAVTPRFRVVKISGEVVELVDLLDNTPLRLALK